MRLTFLHSNKKCLYIHIAIFYCGQFQIIRIKHVLRINADINIINAHRFTPIIFARKTRFLTLFPCMVRVNTIY